MSNARFLLMKKQMFVRAVLVPTLLLLFSWSASATQETFLHTNTVHTTVSPASMTVTETMLRNCFNSGACSSTPANNIYMYPIKCSGSGSNPCTGCWKRVGTNQVRMGNLDPITNSCPAGQIKVYVGYQMTCPGASPSCTNGRLLLGCSIQKVDSNDGDTSMIGYNRECFGGAPIVVDATSAPTVCEAGKYKDSTGNCVACASGTFKAGEGDSVSLCTACPTPRPLPGGQGSGTATTPLGSTSVNDCSYGTITCDNSNWLPDIPSQTCIAPPCNLGLTYTATNPNSAASPSATLGQILPVISGASGTVTTSIVSSTPTTAPNPQTGASPSFGGLGPGSYTVKAVDSVCFRQFTATLVDSPDCNMRLSFAATNPSNSPTYNNGVLTVSITGASGTVRTLLSNPSNGGSTYEGTPAVFSGLSSTTYVVRATDSVCSVEVGAALTNYVPISKCPVGQYLNAANCVPCAGGTYKKEVGDFACTACYRAPIPNGSIVGYSTSPSSGATSIDNCSLSYNCNAGFTPGGSSPIQVNDPSVSCTP